MPTTPHAILSTTSLITLFLLFAPQYAGAQTLVGLHRRDGNETELRTSAKTASTSTLLTSLWVNAAIFGAAIVAFSILRPRFREVYEPRARVEEDKK